MPQPKNPGTQDASSDQKQGTDTPTNETVVNVDQDIDPRAAAQKRDEAEADLAAAQSAAFEAGSDAIAASAVENMSTSSDSRFSEIVDNPNPNPQNLNPPPGPSYIEYRGVPKEGDA